MIRSVKFQRSDNGNQVAPIPTARMSLDQSAHIQIESVDPIRLLIVDDQAVVRAGIRWKLERTPGIEIIAEASDGLEAIRMVDESKPDIVTMDVAMPKVNGLQATEQLAKAHPNVKVIIFSIYAEEEHVWQALRSGAAGYLSKAASMEELEVAIRSVARGETYLSPQVTRPIAEYLHGEGPPRLGGILSTRQRQVLELIAGGKTTKQIALALEVSPKTVETYRAQLMERLDIHDVAGLVRYALKIGLVRFD
jgi:DNA-binding NarL/FixJ family response regulator